MSTRNKTYFISDLHLGASYISDPRQHEMRVVSFLHSIAPDCRRLYLLGDVLDYWWEYRNVVPRGFTRFFGALAALADSGVEITWLKGNHDIWIFDYLPSELGIEVADGVLEKDILGKRFFLSHGDGVGRMPLPFRFMRALFRNRFCQWLYSGIHPRWTIPFALGWSRSSRKRGAQDYAAEEGRKGAERLQSFAESHLADFQRTDFYVFGHVHFQSRKLIGECSEVITLGGWISDFDYLKFDGNRLDLCKWRQE